METESTMLGLLTLQMRGWGCWREVFQIRLDAFADPKYGQNMVGVGKNN